MVRSVTWSGTTDVVASAGAEREVRLWDPITGASLGVLTDHNANLYSVAFDWSGYQLAVGGYSGQVTLYHMPTRQVKFRSELPGTVWSLAFSRDRDAYHILIGRDSRLDVWDRRGTQILPLRVLPYSGRPRALAFTKDGRTLLTAAEDERAVRLVPFDTVVGHTRDCYPDRCFELSLSRGLTYSHEPRDTMVVRRFPGGEVVEKLPIDDLDGCSSAMSPTGDRMLMVGRDAKATWHTDAGRRTLRLPGRLIKLAIAPDNSLVAGSTVQDWRTHVWQADTGEVVATLPGGGPTVPLPVFSPDGKTLATVKGSNVLLWQVGTWAERATLRGIQEPGGMAFDPGSEVLAVASQLNGVSLWDVATGRRRSVLAERAGGIRKVAISPDGKTLATAGMDNSVRLWHLPTGRELFTLHHHFARLKWIEFASSPPRLVVMAEGRKAWFSEVYAFPPFDP